MAVTGTPAATRVGGTFTYEITIANRGKRSATRLLLTVDAAGEITSASANRGACSQASAMRTVCNLSTFAVRARALVRVAVRATALGSLRVAARVASRTRDARPRDNAATATSRVTEPDFARGRGSRPVFGPGERPPVAVEVDAISGPLGHDPAGTFWTRYPGGTPEFRGRVVCLTLASNRASVGGVIEQSNDPQNPPGTAILFGITDNGEPGAGRDTEVTYFGTEINAAQCPVPIFENQTELALTEGNFTVSDVQP